MAVRVRPKQAREPAHASSGMVACVIRLAARRMRIGMDVRLFVVRMYLILPKVVAHLALTTDVMRPARRSFEDERQVIAMRLDCDRVRAAYGSARASDRDRDNVGAEYRPGQC